MLLITMGTFSFLQFPLYARHFAALGDKHAELVLALWPFWEITGVLCLSAAAILIYRMRKDSDDSPVIVNVVVSGTIALAGVAVEIMALMVVGYVWHYLTRHAIRINH